MAVEDDTKNQTACQATRWSVSYRSAGLFALPPARAVHLGLKSWTWEVTHSEDTTTIDRPFTNIVVAYIRAKSRMLLDIAQRGNCRIKSTKRERDCYFRQEDAKTHTPVNIGGAEVEQLNCLIYL